MFLKKNFSFLSIIFFSSLYVALFFNFPLIKFLNHYLGTISEKKGFSEFYYLAVLWFAIFSTTFIFLIILGQRYLLKFFIIFIFITSSIIFYFKFYYNVIVEDAIIRSAFDAFKENNYKEIKELLSLKFFITITLLGVLPSMLVWKINIEFPDFKNEIFSRLKYLGMILILLIGLIGINYKNISLVTRTIKKTNFNYQLVPHYAFSATYHIVKEKFVKEKAFQNLDHQPKFSSSQTKIVGVVVVGETARASQFSLNGYKRKTNPELEKENIINYKDAYSCGTLTNISVPCMFYIGDYQKYNYKTAKYEANVLDVFKQAGADVVWIENNSSCKNVCERVTEINLLKDAPDGNFDELLVGHLKKEIDKSKNNKIIIVLHTMGSHGPAYYKRVPDNFKKFTPVCEKNNPQECSNEEIINSYDNTIIYTDHVLNKVIETLKTMNTNSFMLYASDHGESLGEHGLYLHGLPRSIAPKEQIHIPFLLWLSDEYKKDFSLEVKDTQKEISHENIPHTLMSLMGVESKSLKAEKSLITVK